MSEITQIFSTCTRIFHTTNLSTLQINSQHLYVNLRNKTPSLEKIEDLTLSLLKSNSNIQELRLNLKNSEMGDKMIKYLSNCFSGLLSLSVLKLEIQQNILRSVGFAHLSNGISQLHNLVSLSINSDNLSLCSLEELTIVNEAGKKGISHLANSISKLLQLQHLELNLNRNNIKEFGFNLLLNSIGKLSHLETLSLELRMNKIKDITEISEDKSQDNNFEIELENSKNTTNSAHSNYNFQNLVSLRQLNLNLSNNYFGDTATQELACNISKLANLEKLFLNLQQASVTKNGVESIFFSISKLLNITDLSLKLPINELPSMIFKQLNPFGNSSLKKLNLELSGIAWILNQRRINTSKCNQLDLIGVGIKNLVCLESFKLSLNEMQQTNDGFESLCNGIQSLTALKILSLKFFVFSVDIDNLKCISACFQFLNLQSLDLVFNKTDFNEGCVEELSKGLLNLKQNSKQLLNLVLEINQNSFTTKEITMISYSIAQFKDLLHLDLSLDNPIEDIEAAQSLSEGLEQLSQLNSLTLSISFNLSTSIGVISIIHCLSKLKHLNRLQLEFYGHKVQKLEFNKQLSLEISQLSNLHTLVVLRTTETRLMRNIILRKNKYLVHIFPK